MTSYNSNYLKLLSYTKLLASHVNQSRHDQALVLFTQIHSSFSLDPHIYPLALKSCAAISRPFLGTSIHTHVFKIHLLKNSFVACALVDMYGKCHSVASARKLFDEMPDKDVVVWNAMVSHYVRCGNVKCGVDLFESMDVEPNQASFNSIIAGLGALEDGSHRALEFYRRMKACGLKANLITLLALLPACVGTGDLILIGEVHGYSIRNGIERHPHLKSGLVEAYGRCGCLENASCVFRTMGVNERDVVAWSSLISAYALHGKAESALETFAQMEAARVKPDWITFLGVLKACSHAGLGDEALRYFWKMRDHYGIEPTSDHYSCLVDVLSRAGRLYDAYEVIRDMPVKVTAKAWGALLGACYTYGQVELAEIAGKALFEVEPDNAANYVLLGKIYASVGKHEEAHTLRREMTERKVKIAPGSSWMM